MRTFRRLTAIALWVSMVAVVTSAMMIFVVDRPSFTMHPVHRLLGLLMTASVTAHVVLNHRALLIHIKQRPGIIASGVLVAALVVLIGEAVLPD